MKTTKSPRILGALVLAILVICFILSARPGNKRVPQPQDAAAPAPQETARRRPGDSASRPPAILTRQAETATQQPAEHPSPGARMEQTLIETAVTLAARETREGGASTRVTKSRLLRTRFKDPHVRCDETWEQAPGEEKLLRRELYVADHVMVRFPADLSREQIDAWCGTNGFMIRRRLRTEPVYLIATTTPSLEATATLLEAVRRSFPAAPGGVIAERDDLVFPCLTPGDPSFSQLWGLHNTGQTAGTPDADIDAPEAWDLNTGSADVLVAVIDTGVDATHIDLRDNIWTNPREIAGNGADDDGNGFIDDTSGWDFYTNDNSPFDETGHGTHCAGTIGAAGNNGTGVAGVCWDVSILPVRFLGPVGGSTSDGIDSINYSTALGVDLSSNSWGGGSYSTLMETAIGNANSAGILFVAAAGNDTVNNDSFPHYPSSYGLPNVISVASTTATDALSSFSNYGRTSVDLAAPGTSIYSTVPGGSYATYSGTSMATPHVSGAIALLRSLAPQIDHLQLRQHLLDNVDPLSSMASITSSGGRLNVAKAATLLAGPRVVPAVARIEVTGGNGDAYVNPGEQGEFVWVFRNIGSKDATALSAVLGPDGTYPGISLSNAVITIGDLPHGMDTAEFRIPFTVDASVPTPTLAQFTLTVTDAAQNIWTSRHPLAVHSSSLVTGRVTSVVDGQPITTALVKWEGPTSGAMNVDASGNFSFVAIDGSYTVDATAPGYISLSPVTFTAPPAPSTLQIQLGIPDLAVSPLSVEASAFAGGTSGATVTLTNHGSAPLTWTAMASGGPTPAAPLLDLAGKTIASIGGTSSFLPQLTARGATVVKLGFPLAADALSGIDVLIVEDTIVSAGTNDIALIRSWIAGGGGLFLTADNALSMGNVNAILQGSGVQETSLNTFYTATLTDILPHPSTDDVTSVALTSYGSACTLSGGAVPLMRDSSMRVLGAAVEVGGGRIIAFGNEPDSSISTAGGLLFANQAVDWLARAPRWLSAPDGSGVLAPGASVTLHIVFDTRNLNAGTFSGEIIILSNEPGNPRIAVPVTLHVIGSPAIAVKPASLSFPETFVNGSSTLELLIENPGTDTLTVTSLSLDAAYTTSAAAPFTLAPAGKLAIPVTFAPTAPGDYPATLTITSNSSATPTLAVPLTGRGADGPEVAVNPQSFALDLPRGSARADELVISNNGDATLHWTLDLPDSTEPAAAGDALQELLSKLDANHTAITSLIPNRFDFTDGVTGTYISDGGNDMYDTGNRLATNLSSSDLVYSNGVIAQAAASLGAKGRYFTRKFPGLFVFAAELDGVGQFQISGGLGADGLGSVSATVLSRTKGGRNYTGFVKRVHGVAEPSVNHLIVVESAPGIDHTFSTDTNSDAHAVTGLSGSTRLYYLLFASANGGFVTDATCGAVMDALLSQISLSLPWLDFDADHGSVAAGSQQTIHLQFATEGLEAGTYGTTLSVLSNDPARPAVSVPVSLTVRSSSVLRVAPASLVFSDVPLGTARQLAVDATNTGDAPLVLTDTTIYGSPGFSVPPPVPPVLAPGESCKLYVTFAPESPEAHSATLRIASNSLSTPVVEVPLEGSVAAAGRLTANPTHLNLTLASGQSADFPISLRNSGSTPLTWKSHTARTTAGLSGVPVLLVNSSSSGNPALKGALETLGASVSQLYYGNLTTGSLDAYDVAIFDHSIEYLGSSQINTIAAWLASGGSALVQSGSSSYSYQNTLFSSYGVTLSYLSGSGSWTPSGDHFLTEGITSVTPSYSYLKIATTGSAVPLLRDASGNTRAAIGQTSNSRVALLGGSITTLTGDNLTLINRLVDWLASPNSWVRTIPETGTLPANGGGQLAARLDARDLMAGLYVADLKFRQSGGTTLLTVPVQLTVTGAPDISFPTSVVRFPTTHVGYESQAVLVIANEGSAPLRIDSIATPHTDMAALASFPLLVPPRTSREIPLRFRPTSVIEFQGELEIASNDPDTPLLYLPVTCASTAPPQAEFPKSIDITAVSGVKASTTIRIGNSGGSDLAWSLDFGAPASGVSLEDALADFDSHAALIRSLVPNSYSFSDGVSGDSISDGGNDMYDSGNYLGSNLSTSKLTYSDGTIRTFPTVLGTNGRYFTRKHDGLFLFAADLDGIASFQITGGLGADGYGSVDGAEIPFKHHGVKWRGFVKRVFGAGPPSVNHLVIVEDNPGITHSFPNDSNVDTHTISGLSNNRRLYYLLYAGPGGAYIDNATTTAIMRGFLDSFGESSPWLSASPAAGNVAAGGNSEVTVTADTAHLHAGVYQTFATLNSNDPVRPDITVPATLTVSGSPEILVDPQLLAFPGTIVGWDRTLDLTIHNPGTAALRVTGIQTGGRFTTDLSFPRIIPPAGSIAVPITYTPSTYGLEAGFASITSDAVNLPTTFVSFYGIGTPPPAADVDRTELHVSLGVSMTGLEDIVLTNTGHGNLHWTAGIDYGQALPLAGDLNLSGLTVRLVSSSTSRFDTLIAELTRLGAEATEVPYGSFTSAMLQTTDLLVLDTSAAYLTEANLQAINTWTSAGGGLLITDISSASGPNKALQGCGLQFQNYSTNQSAATDVRYDITTIGVPSLGDDNYTYTRVLATGTAKPLALMPDGSCYAGIDKLGSGRAACTSGDLAYNSYVGKHGNLRYLTNTLAWLAGRVRNWVEPVPASGVVGVNSNTTLSFAFDPSGLVPGTYHADAVIETDDPARPEIRIPVTLEVLDAPVITAKPAALDFEPTVVGLATSRTLTLTNTGQGRLSITGLETPGDFTLSASAPIVLEPSRSTTFTVTFRPTATGSRDGSLLVKSNALNQPVLGIPLTAYGLAAPKMVLTPSEINIATTTNTQLGRTLSLGNSGAGQLTWSVTDLSSADRPLAYPPDLSKTPVGFLTSTSSYSTFRTKLGGYGCTIVNLTYPVQQASLNAIRVLVVDDSYEYSLTTADHTRIRDWVKSGGALMLTAESTSLLPPLLAETGIASSYLYRSGTQTTLPFAHPITSGVASVPAYYAEAMFSLSGKAEALLRFPDGAIYAAAARLGRGHIIAVGNEAFLDNNLAGDGERFAMQCLAWLGGRAKWIEHLQDSGSAPPGNIDHLDLSLDTTGMPAGTYRASLLLASNDPQQATATVPITLLVSATPATADFAQWQYDHFGTPDGTRCGFADDWNRDGVANGLEYYFAIDPTKPHQRDHLPAVGSDENGIFYRYTRLTKPGEKPLRIRHSTDLSTWMETSPASIGSNITSTDNGNGTTTVEVRIPPGTPQRFFRFEVSSP